MKEKSEAAHKNASDQECSASHAVIWLRNLGSIFLSPEKNAGVCHVVLACNIGGDEMGQKVKHRATVNGWH